ncbi:hypothetical protein JRO89_XS01G0351100 [Xanthoceras sorbifolium]|uniref:Uncharacterized protein n=1 Tax=Xanthoceras sorbifolium TaxID=99658 RepID=A0ABQ8INB8_9ROSI|nr:hypothetical protein JRO89_XS01G0351100 [Xanthoceras sorbifolium]
MTCSTLSKPSENFKAEVGLPWSGEYKLIQEDRELQELFKFVFISSSNKEGSYAEDDNGPRVDVVDSFSSDNGTFIPEPEPNSGFTEEEDDKVLDSSDANIDS